jgi:GntP family gluconate:H+ symporter
MGAPVTEPPPDDQLPPLWLSLLPVLLPVLMITANTVVGTIADGAAPNSVVVRDVQPVTDLLGNANFALLISALVSILIYWRQRKPTLPQTTTMIEHSLMSAGVIILITAAGGAFGEMLKVAQIGDAIKELFGGTSASGLMYLFLGFGIASVLKIAQGSSTVAMITAASMLAAMVDPSDLPYDAVYLALAIGAGSKIASWMNDSGFWVFAKMGGLTEVEALKSWTPTLCVLGIVAMAVTVTLAQVLPLK